MMTDFSAPSCSGQEETVYLYLDGELSAIERAAFEAHLNTCPACRELLAEAATLFADLASIETLPVPEADVSVMAQQVMEHLPAPDGSRSFSPLGMLLLAAQLVVGLALLVFTVPKLVAPYRVMLGTLTRIDSATWLGNLRFWIESLSQQTSTWLENQWHQMVDFSLLNISPQVALLGLALLGLAWLLSNGLLLRRGATSIRNGGTS